MKLRSSIAGFFVFGILFGPMFVGGVWLSFREERAAPLLLCIPLIIFYIWLRGFAIIVDRDCFIYRNGFYATRECALEEIKSADFQWVRFRRLGKLVSLPRLVIVYGKERDRITVNPKPFGKDEIRQLVSRLKKASGEPTQRGDV
jgi:hypothetical protein